MSSSADLPLVSIVIPTYNHARFLADAIESVLAQTMQDLEIVVVDDGSTDDPTAVVARYPQVRCLHQRQQGLSAARNAGMQQSSGRYLLFLDADDRLLPRAVESGLRCFEAHPAAAFVSGLHRFVTAEGVPISTSTREPITGDHYLAFLRGNYIGMHATVLYQRQAIAAVGGFDRQLHACEDYDLYLRLSRERPVAIHDELVAEYRLHESNMSGDLGLMLGSVLQALKLQRRHLGADADRHAAYRTGLRLWREHYTDLMLRRLTVGVRSSGGFRKSVRLAVPFLRLAPGTLLRLATSSMTRKIGCFARRGRRALTSRARVLRDTQHGRSAGVRRIE